MAIDCLSAPGENSEINQNYIKSPEVMQPSSSLKLSFKLNLMIVSKSIDLVARSCCNCCIFIVISALILTTTIAASDVLKGALMQPQDGWGHGIIASSVQIMPRRDHGSVARLWSEQSVRQWGIFLNRKCIFYRQADVQWPVQWINISEMIEVW